MATVRKRGARWRVEVRLRASAPESATFRTKAEAVAWGAEREGAITNGRRGTMPVHTLRDVLTRYALEESPKHAGERWERIRCAKIAREFPAAGKALRDLTPADLAGWRDARLRAPAGRRKRGPGVRTMAPASVAREQQLIRTALALAWREWGWIGADQLGALKAVRKPTAAPPRRRGVPAEVERRVVLALGYDGGRKVATIGQRVAVAYLFALETAMRCGEICGLRPGDVELERRFVRLPKTKNGDAREVPLSARAVQLLQQLPTPGPVFDLRPSQVDALFRKAKKRAGIVDSTFHDSRSEGLTRLARKVDALTLARIVGHRDPRSLMIYYAETAESIAARL